MIGLKKIFLIITLFLFCSLFSESIPNIGYINQIKDNKFVMQNFGIRADKFINNSFNYGIDLLFPIKHSRYKNLCSEFFFGYHFQKFEYFDLYTQSSVALTLTPVQEDLKARNLYFSQYFGIAFEIKDIRLAYEFGSISNSHYRTRCKIVLSYMFDQTRNINFFKNISFKFGKQCGIPYYHEIDKATGKNFRDGDFFEFTKNGKRSDLIISYSTVKFTYDYPYVDYYNHYNERYSKEYRKVINGRVSMVSLGIKPKFLQFKYIEFTPEIIIVNSKKYENKEYGGNTFESHLGAALAVDKSISFRKLRIFAKSKIMYSGKFRLFSTHAFGIGVSY